MNIIKNAIKQMPKRKKDRWLGWGMTTTGLISAIILLKVLEHVTSLFWEKSIIVSYILVIYGLFLLVMSFLPLDEYQDDDRKHKRKRQTNNA